jgi:hypothetical protein
MKRKLNPGADPRKVTDGSLNSRKISIMSINRIFLCAVLFLVSGCGTINGEFAYKNMFMDSYRKFSDGMEITSNEKISWTYHVKDKVRRPVKIGVITQKKELVWVDVSKEIITIQKESPNIYGEINIEQEGEYQILLVQDGKLAARVGFRILPGDDDDESDSE